MKNKIIDYIDYIGVSTGTANHPHYQNILNYPPDGYSYRRGYIGEAKTDFNKELDDFLEQIQNHQYY